MVQDPNENEQTKTPRYEHSKYEASRNFLRFLLRSIGFTMLVKLDTVEGLENIPAAGPAILVINHIAFVDPMVVMHLIPRRNIVPMAKIEVYNYPIIGLLPRMWHVIPVRREEADRRAIQMALNVLQAGEMILIAPESTRSPQMQEGKEGIAFLGSRSGAPIIPVALNHTPGFPAVRFSSRWSGPGVQVKFGRPLQYLPDLKRPTRSQMRQMTDEVLYNLAGMLPLERRGYYADLTKSTSETYRVL